MGIIIFLCLLASFGTAQDSCPENVICVNPIERDSCPDQSRFYKDATLFGCCPGCVQGMNGTNCATNEDCYKGYRCDANKKVCTLDRTNQRCEYIKIRNGTELRWKPKCDENGMYAAKQCKGEKASGTCYCVDQKNVRIFGEEKYKDADTMTCACSRQYLQMIADGRDDVTLHCNSRGNYEGLQCDDGICWCANEQTGTPRSIIVPQEMMEILPCYSAEEVGLQYLRQCESAKIQQSKLKNLMSIHGTNNVVFQQFACNYDGSFARTQMETSNKISCVAKNREFIQQVEKQTSNPKPEYCQCAYDKYVTEKLENGKFSYVCDNNGVYVILQGSPGSQYCVDIADGFAETKPGYFEDTDDCKPYAYAY